MNPGLTHDLKFQGELHTRIAKACQVRVQASKNARQKFSDRWNKAEETAQAYLPERDVDALRRAEREAGKPQYTTIQVPYTYAVLMTLHSFLTSVFLSRTPIFQFAGRHGETENQIQAMEALINYQMQVGRNIYPLFVWLFDAPKYGQGIVGTHWERKEHVVSSIEQVPLTDPLGNPLPNAGKKGKMSQRVAGYEGNKLSNIRPMDFFPDPRYPLHDFQRGEFCAVLNPGVSMNRLKELAARGRYTNIEHIKTKGLNSNREPGSIVSELPQNKDISDDFLGADAVELYEVYIELIPKEWKLGNGELPEKWVFTITSDFSVVIGAQPLGALHNEYPFDILVLEPDAYSIFSRSLSDVISPLQQTMDWLVNTHFYNVRKSLNNQLIVDPSRVVMKDVENPLPGGIWRLKPRAYGQDPGLVVKQVPVQDITRGHMADFGTMLQLGERMLGIGDLMQGVSSPTSRRSAAEIRTTANFAISRARTIAEMFSAMGWAPLAEKLVQNSQQYYTGEQKLRLVGDLANFAGENFIEVTPQTISGFYDFVPVDGTMPIDRFAQASLWAQLFGQIRQFPQVAQRYDLAKIFAWVAQLSGLKNIEQFKFQVKPDEQVAQEVQKGNLVPIKGEPTIPRQIPGTGQAV